MPAPVAIAAGLLSASGINPLVAAAGPLFALASQLRGTSVSGDLASLAQQVGQEIQAFEAAARARGEGDNTVLPARYAICTLLDEIVLSTPWGAESPWGRETLLIRFHKESFGGEKFFRILEKAIQDQMHNLVEFLYVCLALGLEGRYKVQQDGHRHLAQVMEQTYEVIRRQRGNVEQELSPHWQGVQDQRPKLARYFPLWAVAAIGAGLLLLIYAVLLYRLSGQADPVVTEIAALGQDDQPLEQRVAAAPRQRATLAAVLAADTQEGLVEVRDLDDRSVVTLWGLFSSGEARIADEQRDMLRRVGQALAQFPGTVKVIGHTDNQPVRSLRFPDNWTLSERRAESVQRILVTVLPAERVRFEARGDSKPLVPNDSATNRAINRRVEVVLFTQAQDL